MPPFHDNKLNTVRLDDSDDQSYTPSKKSAKGKKTTSKPKAKANTAPKKKTSTPTMGSILSKCIPSKRKRDAGQIGTLYQGYNNRSTDSGMAGTPLELISPRPSADSSTFPLESIHAFVGYDNTSVHDTQSATFSNDIADDGNIPPPRLEGLGDQNRLHLNGYDVDQRIPEVYPISPRDNAFAARENRDSLRELPGNPHDSVSSLGYEQATLDLFNELAGNPWDSVSSLAHMQGTFRGQSSLDNYGSGHNFRSDVGLFNGSNTYGGNSIAHPDVPELQNTPNGPLFEQEDAGYVVEDGVDHRIKEERDASEHLVSYTPTYDSEYEESASEDQRAPKVPKINKDGAPRKPRQPRPKLLKWTDNDWKNVALGIVWACGENGVQIPFDQAAQVVGDRCTAGALQQALLKLRGKQIAEGNQIPSLRMAWTRKTRNLTSSSSTANTTIVQDATPAKLPKKKPTRAEGNQTLIITLKRAYQEADRMHIEFPHKFTRVSRQQQRVRTGNAIMINDNPSGDVDEQSTTFHLADQYDDHVMEDSKSSYGLEMNHDMLMPDVNNNGNDMTVLSANTHASYPPQAGDLLPRGSMLPTLSGYQPSQSSIDGQAQFDHRPSTSNPANSNAHRHREASRRVTGMLLDGSLPSPTRPMPQGYNPGCTFISTDPRMRYRKTAVFDNRFNQDGFSMGPQLHQPGQYMPPSPRSSQSDLSGIPFGFSGAYNMTGNPADGTPPTTPANISAHGIGFGMPATGSFHDATDNAPATGGSFDRTSDAYAPQDPLPVTPTRSAAADRLVTDRLNSHLRQDGAFNPQGNRNDFYRGNWDDFTGTNNWSLNVRQNNQNGDIEDDGRHEGEDDSKPGLADPFLDLPGHD